MAASRCPPADVREDSFRTYGLRQSSRTPHTRFPSLTEFPDSPSVYSHTYHTPDVNDANSDALSFSRLSDGAESGFDYDDETASTLRSVSTENVGDYDDDDDDGVSHRISMQGPKIKFHSLAPWETEEQVIAEESDGSSQSGTVGRRFKAKKSKPDSLIRTFGKATSIGRRPSVDSAHSQISATPSFEITAGNYSSSRGALYALARESLSTTSLSSNPALSYNYPNLTHHATQGSLSRQTMEPGGLFRTSTTCESIPIPPSDLSRVNHDRSMTQSSLASSQEHSCQEGFVHPYANPDLVTPYGPSASTRDMLQSDSSNTITDSMSTRSGISSVISTDTSVTSLTSRELPRRVNGKEISPPINVLHSNNSSAAYVDRSAKFLSVRPPAGMDGHHFPSRSSTVTLISLQEAQERERSRGSTIHGTSSTSVRASKGNEDSGSQLPFPRPDSPVEETDDQSKEANFANLLARSRARSTSAGARSRTLQHPLAQSHKVEKDLDTISTSSGPRQLKHKKSGFMRLFGGRNSEEDSPPPIPPLAEEHDLDIEASAKAPKFALPRRSKPPISPTLRSTCTSGDDDACGSSSRKRQPPSLSIVTGTPDYRDSTSVMGSGSPLTPGLAPQPFSLSVPQSAPPGTTDFQGLKLRPVSTSFSSHFSEIVAGLAQSQPDVDTPSSITSPGTAAFPITPVSMRRSDDTPATVVETLEEKCLTVQGLQDQLTSTKKAWQLQVWELRGQIRDLTTELKQIRDTDKEYCEVCGRGDLHRRHPSPRTDQPPRKAGIVNRPRAPTGDAARFTSSK